MSALETLKCDCDKTKWIQNKEKFITKYEEKITSMPRAKYNEPELQELDLLFRTSPLDAFDYVKNAKDNDDNIDSLQLSQLMMDYEGIMLNVIRNIE